MKKLNRTSLRNLILKEIKTINESESIDALENSLRKASETYEKVNRQSGMMAALYATFVELPYDSAIKGVELLTDVSFQNELQTIYNEKGADAAYAHYCEALLAKL